MADYPHEHIETATLKDGTPVLLRPIRPEDAPRLQDLFRRLSPESIRMRFLETAKELTDAQARDLASLDYDDRMALVGLVEEDGQERIVVVARYARLTDRPAAAEAAIVVRDDYQRRGLGKIAMNRLTRYALAHGVEAFVATSHLSNNKVLSFIQRSGLSYKRTVLEPGIWEITIQLKES